MRALWEAELPPDSSLIINRIDVKSPNTYFLYNECRHKNSQFLVSLNDESIRQATNLGADRV